MNLKKSFIRPKTKFILSVKYFLGIIFSIWLLAWIIPLPEKLSVNTHSRLVHSDDGRIMRAYLSSDDKWRFDFKKGEIPHKIQKAVTCLEDKRFYFHFGIDPIGVARAVLQNIKARKIVSGASTISMQLARLVVPRNRTIWAKLIEALRALQFEILFSKQQILQKYLTFSPYGTNIEGIKAAAYKYFNQLPHELDYDELSFLFLLPQSPHRWDNLDNSQLNQLRGQNLEKFVGCGLISQKQRKEMTLADIPKKRIQFNTIAAHLSDDLTSNSTKQMLNTTVSFDLQKSLENYAKSKKNFFAKRGIHNIGIMVVEKVTGQVKAAVGNFDYFHQTQGQFLPSYLAPRSPGSTLKPFLFAQMIQEGMILPETLMQDLPVEFNHYKPENYSGKFLGLVQAQEALSLSLNIPFITGLRNLGFAKFIQLLKSANLASQFNPASLGLSVIIGAIDMNLWDLMKLYTALANQGQLTDIYMDESYRPLEKITWLNKAAVYLTNEVLAKRNRPDFAIEFNNLKTNEKIHWKTGTGQGRRDAWSIGHNSSYVVGVWLGNLNYEASPYLTGAMAASPVMFDIFGQLKNEKSLNSSTPPYDEFESLEVCAFSGFAKGPDCPSEKWTIAVKGHLPEKLCPYHKKLLADKKSGLRINRSCSDGLEPVMKSFLVFNKELATYARKNMRGLDIAPSFHPQCRQRRAIGGQLRIVSPENRKYFLSAFSPQEDTFLPLRFKSLAKRKEIHCLLNGQRLPSSEFNFAEVINVKEGKNHLYCVDLWGRSGEVNFQVVKL